MRSAARGLIIVCCCRWLRPRPPPIPGRFPGPRPDRPLHRPARHRADRPRRPPRRGGLEPAEKSPRFTDLVRGERTIHDTRAAVLWDDVNLYVGYWVEEPFVEGTFTERDSLIYKNNDVELFIAGKDAYYEFEINSLRTIYEVFFIWEQAYESAGFAALPEFARGKRGRAAVQRRGFQESSPRAAHRQFELGPSRAEDRRAHGRHGQQQQGPRPRLDGGAGVPMEGSGRLARPDGRALPPKDGDVWRMDFSRFNPYKEAPPSKDSGGWVWSPHGAWDSHIPEVFPYVRFSTRAVGEAR